MTPTRPTAPQSRPRTPTWWSRCSAHTTSLPTSSLTWRAALSTRTCVWPASPTASAHSPPGPSKSTNATQETRTSSALWTCRWEATSLWLQPCQSCPFSLFFEALLCVGLASKAEAHGNDGFDFLSISASLPHAAVWLKVVGAVGDLVCCEILMILIKITHCWQSLTQCNYCRFLASFQCQHEMLKSQFASGSGSISEWNCMFDENKCMQYDCVLILINYFSESVDPVWMICLQFGLNQSERFLSHLTEKHLIWKWGHLFMWVILRHFEKHVIFKF